MSEVPNYRLLDNRGITIENIHPSDEGVYECRASNKMGSVTASVQVIVHERPVLTVTPETSVQVSIFYQILLEPIFNHQALLNHDKR